MTSAPIPPSIEKYVPVIHAFLPFSTGDELRQRCGMAYLRDRAARGRQICCDDADRVLAVIEALGSIHLYRSMPPAELDAHHRAMLGLMAIATMIDVAQRPPMKEVPDGDAA